MAWAAGTWPIPPFLIVSFLAALFFVTGQGQQRLQEAGRAAARNPQRVSRVVEALQNSLARSVGAQSGFLLTAERRQVTSRPSTEPVPK